MDNENGYDKLIVDVIACIGDCDLCCHAIYNDNGFFYCGLQDED